MLGTHTVYVVRVVELLESLGLVPFSPGIRVPVQRQISASNHGFIWLMACCWYLGVVRRYTNSASTQDPNKGYRSIHCRVTNHHELLPVRKGALGQRVGNSNPLLLARPAGGDLYLAESYAGCIAREP